MTDHFPAAIAAMPERLTAILHNYGDPAIDEQLRDAEEQEGLFRGLAGVALTKARYLFRISALAEEMLSLVDDVHAADAPPPRSPEEVGRDVQARLARLWGEDWRQACPV